MSWETERQNIVTAFKTPWEAGSNLPVQWENIEFDPPGDGSPYLAFAVIRGQSTQMGKVSTAKARFRHPGIVQIDVNIAKGKGTRIATLLVDEIAAIFRGKIISGIIFRAPDVRRITEPETSRVRFIVTIPYHRDSTFTI